MTAPAGLMDRRVRGSFGARSAKKWLPRVDLLLVMFGARSVTSDTSLFLGGGVAVSGGSQRVWHWFSSDLIRWCDVPVDFVTVDGDVCAGFSQVSR